MLFPWHLLSSRTQPNLIILFRYAISLAIFSFHMAFLNLWGFSSSWFSYYQSISIITFAVAISLHPVTPGHISWIIDPIARFLNSIWAFAYLFMFILSKGSPNSLIILCLMLLSHHSIIPAQKLLDHHSDHLWIFINLLNSFFSFF